MRSGFDRHRMYLDHLSRPSQHICLTCWSNVNRATTLHASASLSCPWRSHVCTKGTSKEILSCPKVDGASLYDSWKQSVGNDSNDSVACDVSDGAWIAQRPTSVCVAVLQQVRIIHVLAVIRGRWLYSRRDWFPSCLPSQSRTLSVLPLFRSKTSCHALLEK